MLTPRLRAMRKNINYCKSVPGLLEDHIELTPFRANKADWDEAYWTSLKMDLIKNFSDRRMSHMREVAKVFLADKMQRILAERAAAAPVGSIGLQSKTGFYSCTASRVCASQSG